MMSFIELESPPGVSIRITSAAAWSLSARLIESLTKLAETGLISVFSRIASTSGCDPAAAAGAVLAPAASATPTSIIDQDPSWHSASPSTAV